MSVVDLTTSSYPGNYGIVKTETEQVITRQRYISTAAVNMTSGVYYRIFAYPANTLIKRASIITETVEGAGDTADITDDESGTTTLCSNHDVNTDNAITNYTTGIFKASAGYICVKPDADLATCKFWVVVDMVTLATSD